MDIEFPGKQGQQLSPSVGSADSERSQDRLSAGLYRGIVNQCYAHCRLCRVGGRAYFPKPFRGILGVIGTEVIARTTVQWLLFRNWKFRKISLCDVDRKEAEHFSKWLRDQHNLQVNARWPRRDGRSWCHPQ